VRGEARFVKRDDILVDAALDDVRGDTRADARRPQAGGSHR
jgi:hypothetical protein